LECRTCESLLEAYADGELELSQVLTLEQHLESCPACRQAYAQIQDLRHAVRQEATYYAAPAALDERIRALVPAPADKTPPLRARLWPRRAHAAPASVAHHPSRHWAALGIATAFALLLGLNMHLYHQQPVPGAPLTQALVDDHVRSLVTGHLMDIPSSDTHTVKPWFNGKLDFSPPVQDLKAQGFPLAGGRLDVVNGHRAAVLVYYRNRHPINVFIWPAANGKATTPVFFQDKGYNLAHWARDSMEFWAVSDLNAAELRQFVRLLAPPAVAGA
jgi:anti-sigma factor RsiW